MADRIQYSNCGQTAYKLYMQYTVQDKLALIPIDIIFVLLHRITLTEDRNI